MVQTFEGARKIAANRIGVSLSEYDRFEAMGLKWCSRGKHWERIEEFGRDATRRDKLAASCDRCRNLFARTKYVRRPRQSKRGERFVPGRDGDKIQARGRANRLVRAGLLPNPNDVACSDCGHLGNDRRHEYDHHLGYAAENHDDVQSVCCKCHAKRSAKAGRSTNRRITFRGRTLYLAEWARELGINRSSLAERLEKWNIKKALTTPKMR